MKQIRIDPQVAAVLDATARLSGLEGFTKYNIVLRRLLNLPDETLIPQGPGDSVERTGDGTFHRAVTIDEMVLDTTLKGTKPQRWVDPRGDAKKVEHWADVVVCTAEWLVENGMVTDDQPPIMGLRRHPLLSRSREKLVHPDVARQVCDDWWVETWGNVNTKARNLRRLLGSVGENSRDFKVII